MTTLEVALEIDAPIDQVWRVLTDFENYDSWNRFTPRVETTGMVGEPVDLHVRLNDSGRLRVQTLTVEQNEPYVLVWGDDNLFIKAHRYQTLTPIDEHRTLYESREPFGGLLAPLIIWLMKDKLMHGYRLAAEGLKKKVEGKG